MRHESMKCAHHMEDMLLIDVVHHCLPVGVQEALSGVRKVLQDAWYSVVHVDHLPYHHAVILQYKGDSHASIEDEMRWQTAVD